MLLLVNIGPLNLLQCNYTVDVQNKGYAIRDLGDGSLISAMDINA